MLRNRFIPIILFIFIISCTQSVESVSETQNTPPNILLMIADDWSYPHASIYGDKVIQTPHFDKISEEGILFTNAYCATPSCTASRAAILTGKYPHELGQGASLHSSFPDSLVSYVEVLEGVGYQHGYAKKGWGPGKFEPTNAMDNPAGRKFDDFQTFLENSDSSRPFVFWYGSNDPHRDYRPYMGKYVEMKAHNLELPSYFPDTEVVKDDVLDYYWEVERFDRRIGEVVRLLKEHNQLENTLIVITSDNGMPFPRGKATLYDAGTRIPLAMMWKGKIQPGQKVNDFVNLIDLFPTFMEVAGIQDYPVSGRSLWSMLNDKYDDNDRSHVFLERERHAHSRKGNLSYPSRAIRNEDYLLIHNYAPDRWPSGDPTHIYSVGTFGDNDPSPTKNVIMDSLNHPYHYQLTFKKRSEWELFDIKEDQDQLNNRALDIEYNEVLEGLKSSLAKWQTNTGDLRAIDPHTSFWDEAAYYGSPRPKNEGNKNGLDMWVEENCRVCEKLNNK